MSDTLFGFTPDAIAAALGVHQTTVSAWLRHGDATAPVARPDGRKQRPGQRKAWVPRVKPTQLHNVVVSWREQAADGLSPEQARALLAELEDLLDGWSPAEGATSVNARIVARVAELDPQHQRPVRELADRIGCHTKLIERARTALKRAAS